MSQVLLRRLSKILRRKLVDGEFAEAFNRKHHRILTLLEVLIWPIRCHTVLYHTNWSENSLQRIDTGLLGCICSAHKNAFAFHRIEQLVENGTRRPKATLEKCVAVSWIHTEIIRQEAFHRCVKFPVDILSLARLGPWTFGSTSLELTGWKYACYCDVAQNVLVASAVR